MEDNKSNSALEIEENGMNTGWINEPTVRDLKQDFEDARSDQQSHISDVDIWLDNLNITGTAKMPESKTNSSITPKLIRKQAEWRYASLSEPFLSTEDIYDVAPVTFEDKEAAKQNELVLNNQFNTKLNKVKFINEYVRTAVDEGTVIVRVGWDFEEEEVEVEKPIWGFTPTADPEVFQLHSELHQMMQAEPERYNSKEVPEELRAAHEEFMRIGTPVIATQTGTEIITEIQTIKNQPTLEVCDYRNLSIDPTCMGELDKAGFVTYSFETSKAELEADGKYTNLDEINITSSSILGDPDHESEDDSSFNFNDEPRKKFVAYEYWGFWDIDDSGEVKPIVATWVGDVLIRLEENPYPDKKVPFVSAQYLPVRRSIYGQPDGELLEDNQKIIGAVTRGMIDIMGRSANGQMGTRKDALDLTNKRKFDKGMDYEFNAQVDPRQAFHMHTYPEIPQSAQYMIQAQNFDAESLTGVKAFAGNGGITGAALGDNVGGINSALDATAKREMDILRRLAEGMKQIGRKFIAMNGEFLSETEVVRVTNSEFIPVSRDDLAGNFDLKLSISTAEADDARAKELAFMLQTMGNNMDVGMSKMILSDIATLRKMPTLAQEIKDYEPQPDPLAQQKAQLEIQLLEAQIYNEQAKGNENNANASLDNAKTATENAKVGNINSDTDLKNLEFVETESGTTQERNLQSINEQAKGNIALKAVEGRIKENEQRSKEDGTNPGTSGGL